MNLVVAEDFLIDTEGRGLASGEAERRVSRFLHDIANGAGTLHHTLTGHGGDFNGEQFAAWLEEAGAKRAAGEKTGVAACDADGASWNDCRDALVAKDGPMASLANVASPDSGVFAAACDRTQLDTLGTIIIEKGLPKPPDGASLIYSAIPDAEPVKDALSLRVAVCGRGYSQINVREVKF